MSIYLEPASLPCLCVGCLRDFLHTEGVDFLNAIGQVLFLCADCYSSILKQDLSNFFESCGVRMTERHMVIRNGRIVMMDEQRFQKYIKKPKKKKKVSKWYSAED